MASLNKVRVQLLDQTTGAVIKEVDVLTSADAVSFADGQTFQQKLDAGVLKGAKGDTGTQGVQGIQGLKGDKGDTGAIGATGSTGITGAQGIQGVKGTDGATWISSTGAPTTQGKTGDFYLNTTNFDVYSKATGSWVLTGNIKGATGIQGVTGAQGIKGDTGTQGIQGVKGDTGDTVKIGTTYDTGTTAKLFFKLM